MSYQVLARKWRPKTFSDVVGQEHVLSALANSLSLGRIHHSWLFSGIRGIGKTSIARLLAKGLSCEIGITSTPCCVCKNCFEIEHGRFVDLIEIDAASRTKVEDIRDLLDNMQYVPTYGRFKIYLIDEVHMLSRHSFNALLKTLEEPPAHVKFILATTDPQKLPITILSRCLQFHLKELNIENICSQLQYILNEEKISYDPWALQLLARSSEGSLRDALSLTDQAISSGNGKITVDTVSSMLGMLDDDQVLSLIEAIVESKSEYVMKLVNNAASRGIDWEEFLIEIQSILHRIAMVQLSPAAIVTKMESSIEHRVHKLASTMLPTDVQFYYQTLLIGRKELPFAPDRRMGVEMTLLRALAFHPRNHMEELRATSSTIMSIGVPTIGKGQQLQSIQKLKNKRESERIVKMKTMVNHLTSSNSKQVCNDNNTSVCEQTTIVNPEKKEDDRQKKINLAKTMKEETTLQTMKEMQKKKKTPGLEKILHKEAISRDVWTAEVNKLQLSNLAKKVALNSWKEQNGKQIRLHLRPGYRNILPGVQESLADAISLLHGIPIELSIIEDNDFSMRTPIEWIQAIYEEKLAQARETLIADKYIQMLQRFFDAELDEESIRPT